ncbi:DUF6479 family protein [Streptomyces yanii]|uniref:DUF6479 family protein n=1 Tax=Streptomyces yanii TaxID=78510 RepID=UPI003CD083D1
MDVSNGALSSLALALPLADGRGATGVVMPIVGVALVAMLIGAFWLGMRRRDQELPPPRPDEQPPRRTTGPTSKSTTSTATTTSRPTDGDFGPTNSVTTGTSPFPGRRTSHATETESDATGSAPLRRGSTGALSCPARRRIPTTVPLRSPVRPPNSSARSFAHTRARIADIRKRLRQEAGPSPRAAMCPGRRSCHRGRHPALPASML